MDPVDPIGETNYLIETLHKVVPLYRPEGVTFVTTDKPYTVAMHLHMYADPWDQLNVKERKEKQERRMTSSCESSSYQAESQTKLLVSVYMTNEGIVDTFKNATAAQWSLFNPSLDCPVVVICKYITHRKWSVMLYRGYVYPDLSPIRCVGPFIF